MNCGGGVFRMLDRRGRGLPAKHPFAEWTPGVRRGLLLCLVYLGAMRRGTAARRLAHWRLTVLCVLSELTGELTGVSVLDVIDRAVLKPLLPR